MHLALDSNSIHAELLLALGTTCMTCEMLGSSGCNKSRTGGGGGGERGDVVKVVNKAAIGIICNSLCCPLKYVTTGPQRISDDSRTCCSLCQLTFYMQCHSKQLRATQHTRTKLVLRPASVKGALCTGMPSVPDLSAALQSSSQSPPA